MTAIKINKCNKCNQTPKLHKIFHFYRVHCYCDGAICMDEFPTIYGAKTYWNENNRDKK